MLNSQSTCSQNDEMVSLEIKLIEERSKNMKLESASLKAREKNSEIAALKCKSLDIKLDKWINDYNARTSFETPNSFQSLVDDVNATQSPTVQQQQSIVRPQSPVVLSYSLTVPLQSPILLSSQVNKRNQDANRPSNFLNNLPLSEPREINRKQVKVQVKSVM